MTHTITADADNACVYLSRPLYRELTRALDKSLARDPAAENSLRFQWASELNTHTHLLRVNPRGLSLNLTHGLTRDRSGHILIPCPYLQHILHRLDLPPDYRGPLLLIPAPDQASIISFTIQTPRSWHNPFSKLLRYFEKTF